MDIEQPVQTQPSQTPSPVIPPSPPTRQSHSYLKILFVAFIVILLLTAGIFFAVHKKVTQQQSLKTPTVASTLHALPFAGSVVYLSSNEIYLYTTNKTPHQYTNTQGKVNTAFVDKQQGKIYFTLNAKVTSKNTPYDNTLYSCDLGKDTCTPTSVVKNFGWGIDSLSPDGNYIIGMLEGTSSSENTFVNITTNESGNVFQHATGSVQGCGVHIHFVSETLLGLCVPNYLQPDLENKGFAVQTNTLPIDVGTAVQLTQKDVQTGKTPVIDRQLLRFNNESGGETKNGQLFSYTTGAVFGTNALIHAYVYSSGAPDAALLANYLTFVPLSFLNTIKSTDALIAYMLPQSHPEFPSFDAKSMNLGTFSAFTYHQTPLFAQCDESTCDITNIQTKQLFAHRENMIKHVIDQSHTLYIHQFNNDSLEIWQLLSNNSYGPSIQQYENAYEVVDTKTKTTIHAYTDMLDTGKMGKLVVFPQNNEFLY